MEEKWSGDRSDNVTIETKAGPALSGTLSERNAKLVQQFFSGTQQHNLQKKMSCGSLKSFADLSSVTAEHWTVISLMKRCFESHMYDVVMAMIVSLNVILVIVETDNKAEGGKVPIWAKVTNQALLCGFSIELLVKMMVYGKDFFFNAWNILDFAVVGLDVLSTLLSFLWDGMQNTSMLRIMRLIRIAKSMDFLMMFPELGMMLTSLKGTVKSIFWGCMLLGIVMTIFGILAVQIVHPINKIVADKGVYEGCVRCPRAFENVWESVMTFFQQLIAGDSWGTVSLPIIEESPPCFIFFAAAFISLQLLVTNVILAAVVDAASQARESNTELLEKKMERDLKEGQRALVKLCRQLDSDGNGVLTFEEILEGFQKNKEFSTLMHSMDIHPEDMAAVWGILDTEGTGSVNYQEFASQLYKLKANDVRTMTVFIKHHVTEMRTKLFREIRQVQDSIQKQSASMSHSLASPSWVMEAASKKEEKAKMTSEKESFVVEDHMNLHEFREGLKDELHDAVKQIESKIETMGSLHAESSGGSWRSIVADEPHTRTEKVMKTSASSPRNASPTSFSHVQQSKTTRRSRERKDLILMGTYHHAEKAVIELSPRQTLPYEMAVSPQIPSRTAPQDIESLSSSLTL